MSAIDTLLRGLVDDAALAPPRRLSMPDAVRAHEAARRGPHALLVGRFMTPARRLPELAAALAESGLGAGWRIGVVADGDLFEQLPAAPADGAVVDRVEGAFPLDAVPTLGCDLLTEISLGAGARERVATLARAASGVKIRCGGADAAAFPQPRELVEVIAACVRHGVPLKATQGLHHPVRQPDPGLGVLQHGFLNLLAATGLLAHGRIGEAEAEELVVDADPHAFRLDPTALRWRDHALTEPELAATRSRVFVGLGSCSLDEPIDGLARLGVFAAGAAR